jgi:hypothetical protein
LSYNVSKKINRKEVKKMRTSIHVDAILIIIAVALIVMTAYTWAQCPTPTATVEQGEASPILAPSLRPAPERSAPIETNYPQPEKTVYQQVDKLVPGPTKTVVVEKPGPTVTVAPAIKDQKTDINSGFNTSLPTAEKQREIRIVQAEIYGHETIVVPQKKAEATIAPPPTQTAAQKTETKPESEKDLAIGVGLFWAKVLEWVTKGIVWLLATAAIIGMIILLVWGLILAITAIINALRGGNVPAEPAVPEPAPAAVTPVPARPAPATGGPMPEPPAPPVI